MSQPSNPNFHMRIAHGVDEIAPAAWDALSSGQHFQSGRWYRFGEAVMADSTPSYIILESDGQPVARAALWPVRDEPLPLNPPPLRSMAQAYLRRRPLMVCRSPLSGTPGLVLPPGPPSAGLTVRAGTPSAAGTPAVSPSRSTPVGRRAPGPNGVRDARASQREAAMRALVTAAREQARLGGASFLVLDFITPELRALADCGLALGEVAGPGTLMELPWGSFEGFLGGLDKNSRKHYKRTQRKCREMGITITRHSHVDRIPEALGLIRNMERRFGSAPNPWMAGMMQHLERVEGTWLAAEMDGKLVACELALQDNGAQLVTALGLADDVPYAYFALGYEDIRLAIESGAGALYWGSGAYDLKQRLGFRLYPNNLVAFAGLGTAPRMIARVAAAFL